MTWSVDDFKARTRDFQRKYMFRTNILFPTAIPGGTSELINILAESVNLPGKKIDKVDVDYAGSPYQVAGKVTYPDWKVTFRMDDNLDVYKKFKAWQELIVGTKSNIAAFPAQYKSNPELVQLDGAGNDLTKIVLNGAWVTEIGDVEYDTKDKALATVAVTFAYDYNEFIVL